MNRFISVAGTIRQLIQGGSPIDVPTIIRLDTKTGQTWYLEGLPGQGMEWITVLERQNQPQPTHDN